MLFCRTNDTNLKLFGTNLKMGQFPKGVSKLMRWWRKQHYRFGNTYRLALFLQLLVEAFGEEIYRRETCILCYMWLINVKWISTLIYTKTQVPATKYNTLRLNENDEEMSTKNVRECNPTVIVLRLGCRSSVVAKDWRGQNSMRLQVGDNVG